MPLPIPYAAALRVPLLCCSTNPAFILERVRTRAVGLLVNCQESPRKLSSQLFPRNTACAGQSIQLRVHCDAARRPALRPHRPKVSLSLSVSLSPKPCRTAARSRARSAAFFVARAAARTAARAALELGDMVLSPRMIQFAPACALLRCMLAIPLQPCK